MQYTVYCTGVAEAGGQGGRTPNFGRIEGAARQRRRTVSQDCQKSKETIRPRKEEKWLDMSGPLADKQQKIGEHVENINFS